MLCVLGVLKTSKGLQIKNEMLSWLNTKHNVFCVEQEPPGKLFEYPAIYYAIKLAIEMNEPVLYLHTKGAANYAWYQIPVRQMWKNEFGTDRIKLYLDAVNCIEPAVSTPISKENGSTVFNGFIMNPSAAKLLQNTFHQSSDRFYFENLFNNNEYKISGILTQNATEQQLENMQHNKQLFNYA